MKTMTLNLPEREMQWITDEAKHQCSNKTAIVRCAIRIYQAIKERDLEPAVFDLLCADFPPKMATDEMLDQKFGPLKDAAFAEESKDAE